jgi:prenyltransferase beta subunit
MLQVARLAPTQLGESRDLVAAFLHARRNPDGGFQDRSGTSDLYYTVFGLDALIALRETLPTESTAAFLRQAAAREPSDLVHLACLARGFAALRIPPDAAIVEKGVRLLDAHRSADGGFATEPAAAAGSAYGAFVAAGAYQDFGRPVPDPDALLASMAHLKMPDGSYCNHPSMPVGLTTSTAAAVLVTRQFDGALSRDAGMWLLDRCHPRGGFFAAAEAPVPDLLSTATALHALAALQVPIAGLREPCLDFVDSLWTNRGGFFATWADDEADCEYTYYGLLALGHLSLES